MKATNASAISGESFAGFSVGGGGWKMMCVETTVGNASLSVFDGARRNLLWHVSTLKWEALAAR